MSVGFRDRDSFAPFAAGLVLAFLVHGSLAATTQLAPPKKLSERVEMALYKPPPPPPPPPEPPPPPPEEKKKPPPPPPPPPPPEEPPPPPPPNQDPPPDPPKEPVPIIPGLSFASTVAGGAGPAMPVGNTTMGEVKKFVDPKDVKPYAGPSEFKAARASAVSRQPRVLKDFKGPFPRDLAEQGIEGAVVLLIQIFKDASIGTVKVVKSSGNGTLDRLAQEYVKRFRFAPAEVDGEKVDFELRYTYRFELYD